MCFLQIVDLLEDKDANKSKPKVNLKVNPEAKDHSISSYLRSQIKDLLEASPFYLLAKLPQTNRRFFLLTNLRFV